MTVAAFVLATALARSAELQIEITPTHDGSPLFLSSLRYPLGSGEPISITRLSYLVSGFALEKTDGGWVELPGQVAWMDAGGVPLGAEDRRALVAFLNSLTDERFVARRSASTK